MIGRPCLLGLAAAGLAVPLQAQTVPSQFDTVPQLPQIDGSTQTDDIRFNNDGYERMTVPVHVGGTGPYRFLVDTGADRTAISREIAGRLGLVAASTARLHSVIGAVRVSVTNVPLLQLSRREVRDIEAPLLERSHMGADGILGTDSLRSQRVVFDFKAQTLSIVPSQSRPVEEDEGAIVVTGRMKSGRLIVTDARADGQGVRVVLDTGAQYSVANEALMKRLQRRGVLSLRGETVLVSVTGDKAVGQIAILRELEIGGVGLTGLPIVFTKAPIFKQLGLDNRPALLLGMNALRGFDKVSIDFATRKLRLVLPEEGSLGRRAYAARWPASFSRR